MAETVIDSRVAQLEAALAEISRENERLTKWANDWRCTNCDQLCQQVATLHQEQARLTEALEEAQYQPELWAVLRIVSRERDEALAAIEAVRAYLDPAKWTRASEQGQGVLALLPASPPETARAGESVKYGASGQGSNCPECGPNVSVDSDGCCVSCGCDAMVYRPASPTPTKEPHEPKCSNCHGTGRGYYGVLCLRCSGTGIDPSITSSHVTSDHISQPGEMVAPPPTEPDLDSAEAALLIRGLDDVKAGRTRSIDDIRRDLSNGATPTKGPLNLRDDIDALRLFITQRRDVHGLDHAATDSVIDRLGGIADSLDAPPPTEPATGRSDKDTKE